MVTGAASGIGQAIAKSFAAEGAHVAIADLNQTGAEATAVEIGRRLLGSAGDQPYVQTSPTSGPSMLPSSTSFT